MTNEDIVRQIHIKGYTVQEVWRNTKYRTQINGQAAWVKFDHLVLVLSQEDEQ